MRISDGSSDVCSSDRENRLAVAREEVDIASRYPPFAQGFIYQCAVGLPDERMEAAQHLLVNGTFGKGLAYSAAEIGGIIFRVKPEKLECGIGSTPRNAAERDIQTIQGGARHQSDDQSGGLP